MSQLKSIKGNTVFMVLYNYSDCDYSIVKIMENLDDAYKYICLQESNDHDNIEEFYKCVKMIDVNNPTDITDKFVDEFLNICYISSGKYNKFSLCDYSQLSSYAIAPMVIG